MFQAILCDDNEIILEGLSSQIKWKDLGIELTATAADGNEAWELIQKNPPDLLITDIRMPYMDGLELSKKARELNPNIVILIISAYDDFQYARTAMHLQALHFYLLKHFCLTNLSCGIFRQFFPDIYFLWYFITGDLTSAKGSDLFRCQFAARS